MSMTDEDWCNIVNEKDAEIEHLKDELAVGLGLSRSQIGEHPLHAYEMQYKLEQYDILTTTIRNILTDAGIPDWEPYPDEDVDEHEKSLRAGGRMIPLDKRVQMLVDRLKTVYEDGIEEGYQMR